MTQKYEKVDLGNVKGKNGQDGMGIEEFRFITDIDPTTHLYHVVYTDEGKAPTEVILHDGDVTIVERALENYIQKSNTNGLLKNDGTIDTTTYSTFDGSYDNLTDKPNIPNDVAQLTDNNNTQFTPRSHNHGQIQNDGTVNNQIISFDNNDIPLVADYSEGNSVKLGKVSSDYIIEPTKDENLTITISNIDTELNTHNHDDKYYTKNELNFTQKQSLQSGKILVFSNAFMVHVMISGTFSGLTANGVTTLSNTTITETYRPKYSTAVWGNGDGRFGAVSVTSAGAIKIVNNSSDTSLNIHTSVTYPLKSVLP